MSDRMPVSKALLCRLRSGDRVIALDQSAQVWLIHLGSPHSDVALKRVYAGSEQRAAGAWSWTVIGGGEAGSHQTMTEVLKSDLIEVSTTPRNPAVQIVGITKEHP